MILKDSLQTGSGLGATWPQLVPVSAIAYPDLERLSGGEVPSNCLTLSTAYRMGVQRLVGIGNLARIELWRHIASESQVLN